MEVAKASKRAISRGEPAVDLEDGKKVKIRTGDAAR